MRSARHLGAASSDQLPTRPLLLRVDLVLHCAEKLGGDLIFGRQTRRNHSPRQVFAGWDRPALARERGERAAMMRFRSVLSPNSGRKENESEEGADQESHHHDAFHGTNGFLHQDGEGQDLSRHRAQGRPCPAGKRLLTAWSLVRVRPGYPTRSDG